MSRSRAISVVVAGLTGAGVVASTFAFAAAPAAAVTATRYYKCVDAADVNCIESIEFRLDGSEDWQAATASAYNGSEGNLDLRQVWTTPGLYHEGAPITLPAAVTPTAAWIGSTNAGAVVAGAVMAAVNYDNSSLSAELLAPAAGTFQSVTPSPACGGACAVGTKIGEFTASAEGSLPQDVVIPAATVGASDTWSVTWESVADGTLVVKEATLGRAVRTSPAATSTVRLVSRLAAPAAGKFVSDKPASGTSGALIGQVAQEEMIAYLNIAPDDGGSPGTGYAQFGLQSISGAIGGRFPRDGIMLCGLNNEIKFTADTAGDFTYQCFRAGYLNRAAGYRMTVRVTAIDTVFGFGSVLDPVVDVLYSGATQKITLEGTPGLAQWWARPYDEVTERMDGTTEEWGGWFPSVTPDIPASCQNDKAAFATTNGFGGQLPRWDPVAETLTYATTGRHLDTAGNVYSGRSQLTIPTALAACLWGVVPTQENLAGKVVDQQSNDAGASISIREVGTDLVVVASGYTYSTKSLVVEKVTSGGTDNGSGGTSGGSSTPTGTTTAVVTPVSTTPTTSTPTTSTPTTSTPTVTPAAKPVVAVSRGGARAVLRPLAASTAPADASWVASSLRLVPYKAPRTPVKVRATKAGTWRVNTTTGAITFTPADGFLGKTSMGYRVRATDGSVFSSFVTAVVRR